MPELCQKLLGLQEPAAGCILNVSVYPYPVFPKKQGFLWVAFLSLLIRPLTRQAALFLTRGTVLPLTRDEIMFLTRVQSSILTRDAAPEGVTPKPARLAKTSCMNYNNFICLPYTPAFSKKQGFLLGNFVPAPDP